MRQKEKCDKRKNAIKTYTKGQVLDNPSKVGVVLLQGLIEVGLLGSGFAMVHSIFHQTLQGLAIPAKPF
jgi:hypothetical protein